jgi:hypothetical protein
MGALPTAARGPVLDEDGNPLKETWIAIHTALRRGNRGLPGGSSIPDLIRRHGLKVNLSEERIFGWMVAHHKMTGAFPTAKSGAVLDEAGEATGESWSAMNAALRHGLRGLPGGLSLAQLTQRIRLSG